VKTPAVDGQVVDLRLNDILRDVDLVFGNRCGVGYFNGRGGSLYFQLGADGDVLTHQHRDVSILELCETGCVNRELVTTTRNQGRGIEDATVAGGEFTMNAEAFVIDQDFSVRHGGAGEIGDNAG
jgi:hypothetical protein